MLLVPGCFPAFELAPADAPELAPEGAWAQVELGGDTISSDGTPFEMNFKRGSSGDLMIYFAGGGAAWDGVSASHPITLQSYIQGRLRGLQPGFYVAQIYDFASLMMVGILDVRPEMNPFSDWNIAYIPYTTGDFQIGDAVRDYGTQDGATVTVRHNGYRNTVAALEYIKAAVPEPRRLLVAGQSAGGFAAAIWFDRIASMWPGARHFLYADAAWLYAHDTDTILKDAWGADLEGNFGFTADHDVMDSALRFILEKYGPGLRVLLSHTVNDAVLPWFQGQLTGQEDTNAYRLREWTIPMLASTRRLMVDYPNVHVYLTDYGADERGHTAHTLSQAGSWLRTDEEGVSLADWLSDNVHGGWPYSVGLDWFRLTEP